MVIDCLWMIAQTSGSGVAHSGSSGGLVHWFTVFAQVVNFLILVILLRRFLFGRIVESMDRRQEQIASRWDEAGTRQQEAKNEADHYRQRLRELNDRDEEMLAEAKRKASLHRQELIDEARDEIELFRLQWLDSIRQERNAFLDEIRHRAVEGTCSIARRFLGELADSHLEEQMVRTFFRRLGSLDPNYRDTLRESLQNSVHRPILRSSFEIPEDQQVMIEERLRCDLGVTFDLKFEIDAKLLCGIELNTDGRKLGWNITESLEALVEELSSTICQKISETDEPRVG